MSSHSKAGRARLAGTGGVGHWGAGGERLLKSRVVASPPSVIRDLCGLAGLVLVIAAVSPASAAAATRATGDRPDDFSGPQVHAIYAVPAGGLDHSLDTNGAIATVVANLSTRMRAQTGGRAFRYDTASGELDVTFLPLRQTDAQISSHGAFAREALEAEVRDAGLATWDKIYEVFYDGTNTTACGNGVWPPALAGNVVAAYLHAVVAGYAPCDLNPFPTTDGSMGYWGAAVGHEVMHAIGLVGTCSPNHVLSGHVGDSPSDLMYAGPLPWYPTTLDVGHDDYFGANVPGCVSLESSAFFDGGTLMPPGWPAEPMPPTQTPLTEAPATRTPPTPPLPAPVASKPPPPASTSSPATCRAATRRHSKALLNLRAARKRVRSTRGRKRVHALVSYRHWVRVERHTRARANAACPFGIASDRRQARVAFPALREALSDWRAATTSDGLVFATTTGAAWQPTNVRRRILAPAVEIARENASLPDVTPHGLRRTYVSICFSLGVPATECMASVGHTSAALTLEFYARPMSADLDAAASLARVVGLPNGESPRRLPQRL